MTVPDEIADDEITDAEHRLNRLLRDHLRSEPFKPIVKHALTETFKERFSELANDYELRFHRHWIPGNAAKPVDTVSLRFLSAVDRLAGLL